MDDCAMNRWNLGWRASARLRYGLAWREHAPTMQDYPQARTYAVRLLMILAIWGWAMDQDYISEQASAAASAEIRANRAEHQLLDCLNGRARWISADEKTLVACDAWTTRL